MSIPDETRSPARSSDYNGYNDSSFRLSDIGNFTYDSSSMASSRDNAFSYRDDVSGQQMGFRYTEL